MSLFKVRNFWSLALNQLLQDSPQKETRLDVEPASFSVDVGQFHSVGQYHVFVCASLNGLIFIAQVPNSVQLDIKGQNSLEDQTETSENNEDFRERQILSAKQLDETVIDLKCGFFLSTLKQSVAVLSIEKIYLYQVKRNQVDLLSSNREDGDNQVLDESMFSHRLEQQIQLDCMKSSIAAGLVVLDQHSASSLSRENSNSSSSRKHQSNPESDKSARVQAKLHLPQRDIIAVQYTNQFVFTIVEHKKVIGHYDCLSIESEGTEADQQHHQTKLALLCQSVGPMPMAFLRDRQMLVLSHSDNKIRAILLQKLVSQAKQSIMQRVAADLLQDKPKEKPSSLAYDKTKHQSTIRVDLEASAEWTIDMVLAPIQMQSLSRLDGASQLLVMTRYSLSLISSTSGQRMWSQRYEAPLICFHSYFTGHSPISSTGGPLDQEKPLTLLSSDCLGQDKSNLLVLDDQNAAWSALLAQKPMQIWRINLSKMSGVVASIGASDCQLLVSYLGTNSESNDEELLLEEDINHSSGLLALEMTDDPLFGEDCQSSQAGNESFNLRTKRWLSLDVKLEAVDHWPNVTVRSTIAIEPATSSRSMLQNIVMTLQFDDLIEFEHEGQPTSGSPLNFSLGTCWPDRREPLVIKGSFTLKSSMSSLTEKTTATLIPKSLKICVLLRYTETEAGPCLQEEFFMLPLNMLAQLVHIDYSSGLNQSLEDVQSNLSKYKRQPSLSHMIDRMPNNSPYFLCDLHIRGPYEMLELIEEIVESDLVCRGLNSEHINYSLDDRKDWRAGTLENINLLAQSLDCRLKYKSLSHPSTSPLVKQSSEDQNPVVMVSFGFKIQNAANLLGPTGAVDEAEPYARAWLHLCNLAAADTNLPTELVKQHMKEWKYHDFGPVTQEKSVESSDLSSILITIESDYPSPVLFFQDHLRDRIERRLDTRHGCSLYLDCLTSSVHDQIEIDQYDLTAQPSFVAISENLHESLSSTLRRYDESLKPKYDHLKSRLVEEQSKFYISTMTIISMAKRYASLPTNLQDMFGKLSKLTNQYHQNLVRILHDLENLRILDYRYSKTPRADDIVIERNPGLLESWPDYVQTII